jgi:hypothetical protein
MNPTPSYSPYIWAGLFLFAPEFGGQAAYMETYTRAVFKIEALMWVSNLKGWFKTKTSIQEYKDENKKIHI